VVLEPTTQTRTTIQHLGRNPDSFFLHGGTNAGSGGCIDCGGRMKGNAVTERLLRDLRAAPGGKSTVIVHGRLIWLD